MSSTQLTPEYVAFDQGPGAIRAMSSILGITTAVVVLRFGFRALRKIRIGLEDWSMAAALFLVWASYALAVCAILYGGFGRHEIVVYSMDPTYHILNRGQLMVWIGQLVYVPLITTVKLSVLSTYLRIFPTRFVKWGARILGTIAVMWFISALLVAIFQCDPVARSWDYRTVGTCLDREMYLLSNSIPNILTDIAILCLPMYEVYHLQVNRAKKIGLSLVFLLGSLVIAISIYRLTVLIELNYDGGNLEYTIEMNKVNIWTVVEPAVGMICASVPTLGPLFSQFGRLSSCLRSNKAPKRDERRADLSLVTIGGSGRNGLSRKFLRGKMSGQETLATQSTFERLPDTESGTHEEFRLAQSGHMTLESA